jgi:hypothetical protein
MTNREKYRRQMALYAHAYPEEVWQSMQRHPSGRTARALDELIGSGAYSVVVLGDTVDDPDGIDPVVAYE